MHDRADKKTTIDNLSPLQEIVSATKRKGAKKHRRPLNYSHQANCGEQESISNNHKIHASVLSVDLAGLSEGR